jgi:hypothetical protein
VTVIHVSDDMESAESLRRLWNERYPGVALVIIESPFRQLTTPLLAYIDAVREQHPADTVTVILPEFVPRHWWEHLLHNQSALRLKATLLGRPGVVVVSVPYHLPSREQEAVERSSIRDALAESGAVR